MESGIHFWNEFSFDSDLLFMYFLKKKKKKVKIASLSVQQNS